MEWDLHCEPFQDFRSRIERIWQKLLSILLLDDVDVAFRRLFWLLLRFNMKL